MNLDRLLRPGRVAVIGVSTTNDNHPANVIFRKLQLRYPVDVFAVNNRGGELHGVPVYPGIAAIPATDPAGEPYIRLSFHAYNTVVEIARFGQLSYIFPTATE